MNYEKLHLTLSFTITIQSEGKLVICPVGIVREIFRRNGWLLITKHPNWPRLPAILILTFFWNCFASFGPLDSLTSLCLDFEGKSIGCNLPPDLIQIAQYLKMFSIHSCQPWICSQNFHSQPYLYDVQGRISYFWMLGKK